MKSRIAFFASSFLSLGFLCCDCLHLTPLTLDVVSCTQEGEEVVELPQGDVKGLEVLVHLHLSCSRQSSQDAGDEE